MWKLPEHRSHSRNNFPSFCPLHSGGSHSLSPFSAWSSAILPHLTLLNTQVSSPSGLFKILQTHYFFTSPCLCSCCSLAWNVLLTLSLSTEPHLLFMPPLDLIWLLLQPLNRNFPYQGHQWTPRPIPVGPFQSSTSFFVRLTAHGFHGPELFWFSSYSS